MSRRRKKKQQKVPQRIVHITHHADRRCIVGQPVTPKKTYRPTAR